jgi:prevent-host-death family protein
MLFFAFMEDVLSLSLMDDIKTVSELRSNLRGILRQVRETGRPVMVTCKGKPNAVLINVTTYKRMLKAMNMTTFLARGEEDIRHERTRSARAFLQEFQRTKKIET